MPEPRPDGAQLGYRGENLSSFLRRVAHCKTITPTEEEQRQLLAAATLLEDAVTRHRETERLRILLAWALAYVPDPTPSQAGGTFARRHYAALTLTEGLLTQ
jgi:hypothetical protein